MKRQCIKVSKKKGEPIRRLLLQLEILDNSVKIGSDEIFLYLPLIKDLDPDELKTFPYKFELIEFDFALQEKKPVPEDLLGFSPAYEVIGDIALLEDLDLDKQKASKIADALLRTQPNIKTVLMREGIHWKAHFISLQI